MNEVGVSESFALMKKRKICRPKGTYKPAERGGLTTPAADNGQWDTGHVQIQLELRSRARLLFPKIERLDAREHEPARHVFVFGFSSAGPRPGQSSESVSKLIIFYTLLVHFVTTINKHG